MSHNNPYQQPNQPQQHNAPNPPPQSQQPPAYGQQSYGPPPPHYGMMYKRRRRDPRGCLVRGFLALLVMMFACGACLAVYIIIPVPQVDILIMGLDGREGNSTMTRTDSVMLMGIDPSRLRVSLLSIPRDLFIEVPGYGAQRINTVNVLGEQARPGGGPELLKQSIQRSFNVTPDRFVRLNFSAFVSLIDAVGGVDIYVERTIVDTLYPTEDFGTQTIRFDEGWQHMDGERALKYARTRMADDDYRRAERQQQVVRALAARLINPLTWPAATLALSQSVETDLTIFDFVMLAPPVLISGGSFDTLVIDRDYIVGTGQGYAIPNYNALAPWIQSRFD